MQQFDDDHLRTSTTPLIAATESEQFLDLLKGPFSQRHMGFMATSSMSEVESSKPPDPSSSLIGIRVGVPNKVSGGDATDAKFGGMPISHATKWWPVAVFWALTGASHTAISLDSGVCAHPISIEPGKDPDYVITLMASWDHWFHEAGRVGMVDLPSYAFEPVAGVPWLFGTRTNTHLFRAHSVVVDRFNLPIAPIECVPDTFMLEAGATPRGVRRDLPLRGPHTPFDANYACGATGGQLLAKADGTFHVIGDHFVPLEERQTHHINNKPPAFRRGIEPPQLPQPL